MRAKESHPLLVSARHVIVFLGEFDPAAQCRKCTVAGTFPTLAGCCSRLLLNPFATGHAVAVPPLTQNSAASADWVFGPET